MENKIATLKTEAGRLEVVLNYSPLWWHKKGLMFTRSGYGSKIPTEYTTNYNGRTYRVYCAIWSNCGTLYIKSKGKNLIID